MSQAENNINTTKPARTPVVCVVLKDKEHDVQKEGIVAVDFETYKKVAVAGGFIDHSQDVGNHYSPLDVGSLRILRDDPKADGARRQAAGDRLKEVESILGGQ